MKLSKIFLTAVSLLPGIAFAQGGGLKPEDLLKPLKDDWPTYNGDYTGKRFSELKQINRDNVQHMTLAWSARFIGGMEADREGGGRRNRVHENLIVGGEGPGNIAIRGGSIKASVLEVDNTLYFTMPDNAWAVDAHDGRVLWHYFWKTKGGTHIGNRGLAMWNGYLYMETPDDYLVCLEAKTGKERWHKVIADVDQGYFSTPAPIIAGNHVLVGTGNDIDSAGFLK
jgi:alcohol dehydrogenase (cytochrome c)